MHADLDLSHYAQGLAELPEERAVERLWSSISMAQSITTVQRHLCTNESVDRLAGNARAYICESPCCSSMCNSILVCVLTRQLYE